jgi:hypothetical protein
LTPKPFCRNGHRKTKTNTGYKLRRNKNDVRFEPYCKACASDWARNKYQEDAEYRERRQSKCRARYHLKKSTGQEVPSWGRTTKPGGDLTTGVDNGQESQKAQEGSEACQEEVAHA